MTNLRSFLGGKFRLEKLLLLFYTFNDYKSTLERANVATRNKIGIMYIEAIQVLNFFH